MTAGGGYFAVIAVRPRPASKRRRRFRPALGRTATLPSVPVCSDPGRTGRLTSLLEGRAMQGAPEFYEVEGYRTMRNVCGSWCDSCLITYEQCGIGY